MAYEHKPNSGALFINDRKEKATHPDLKGKINVAGVDYYLSAWQKSGPRGDFYSLSLQPIDGQQRQQHSQSSLLQSPQRAETSPPVNDLDDEIPF